MKYLKRAFIISAGIWMLHSCHKAHSNEGSGTIVDSLPIGNLPVDSCRIRSMNEFEYNTKVPEHSYTTTYTSDNKASVISTGDSINKTSKIFSITYPNGKVQVDANQYFIVSTSGNVTEFHGNKDPLNDKSSRVNVKYKYNRDWQLIKRTEEYDSLPGNTSLEADYTYLKGNLVRSEVNSRIGTALKKIIDVSYRYDDTVRMIKKFIYFLAAAPEIFYFQNAINAGPTSANLLSVATTTFINNATGTDSTVMSIFANYKYHVLNSTYSYALGFDAFGSDFSAGNMYSRRIYFFMYTCF